MNKPHVIVEDLRDFARDYTTTTYQEDLILRAANEIERMHAASDVDEQQKRELRAEIATLRASERSAWNAAIERDRKIEELRKASPPYIGATVVVAGCVEAWFMAADAAEDWAAANCPNGYSIGEADDAARKEIEK